MFGLSRFLSRKIPTTRKPAINLGSKYSLEGLENRLLLSISWINQGDPSDGFDSAFGSDAAAARAVVVEAIDSWERVITNFNFTPGNGNDHQVTISMATTGTGHGGETTITAILDGKPTASSITLLRGNDLTSDGLGDGGGYYIDPTPRFYDEYTTIENVFSAFVVNDTSYDLLTLVNHELMHSMGIAGDASLLFQSGGFLTDTGSFDSSGGRLFAFQGDTISHLMTSNNGGLDAGVAVHTAAAESEAIVQFENEYYWGAEDLGNPFLLPGRRLIPNTIAMILEDAYDYTVTLPDRFGTFYSNGCYSTGSGGSEVLTIIRVGNTLTSKINFAIDVPGTGHLPGPGDAGPFISIFDLDFWGPCYEHVQVHAGGGDDTINADGGGGHLYLYGEDGNDWIDNDGPSSGANSYIFGGAGDDILQSRDASDELSGGDGYDTIWGGGGNDVVKGGSENDFLKGGTGNDYIDGGSNRDTLYGQDGNDTLIGGLGADDMRGGAGNDSFDGGDGAGTDSMYGESGVDTLIDSDGGDVWDD
jgi:Ca2+-binding RTX toxin-like protein